MMREIIFVATMLFSTTLRAAFGFGNALLAMPILVLLYGLQTATPVIGISALFIAAVILIRDYEHVEIGSVVRLILSSVAGIPLGIILLSGNHESMLICALGTVLMIYGIFMYRMPVIRSQISIRFSYIAGFIAGILGGAYNTNGPPAVIYATLRGWNPAEFRASLQGYFLITGIFVAAGHWANGLWTPKVLSLCLLSILPIFVGLVLGTLANCTFEPGRFKRYVSILLIFLGIIMIVQGLR